MNTKIQKWGNSPAVRLPKEIADKHFLREGSNVSVLEGKEQIIIKPIKKKKTDVKLSDLTRKISSKNIHKEISFSDAVGNEIW